MRRHCWLTPLTFAIALAACDKGPVPASSNEVADLERALASMQAQLDAEVVARKEATASCEEQIAELADQVLSPTDDGKGGGWSDLVAINDRLTTLEFIADYVVSWVDEDGASLASALNDVELLVSTQGSQLTELEDSLSTLTLLAQGVDDRTREWPAQEEALEELWSVMFVDADSGLVLFEGVNLQVRSGGGATNAAPNGLGNVIVGYDEGDRDGKTGSHSLIVGPDHAWSSYGSVLLGSSSISDAPGANVLGGANNAALAMGSTVVGGFDIVASTPGEVAP